MKDTLKPGIKFEHRFFVPPSKTVPSLYPESEEFVAMPEVFATGFLVGFLEWSCIKAINPHLDWPEEQPAAQSPRGFAQAACSKSSSDQDQALPQTGAYEAALMFFAVMFDEEEHSEILNNWFTVKPEEIEALFKELCGCDSKSNS
jgi:hypothetical protein